MLFFVKNTSKILQSITQKHFSNVLPSISTSVLGKYMQILWSRWEFYQKDWDGYIQPESILVLIVILGRWDTMKSTW